MASSWYYAVRVGRAPGIYTSWDSCKKQVQNYKGAVYKKFPTFEEAQVFLGTDILTASESRHGLWYVVKDGPAKGIYSNYKDCQRATNTVNIKYPAFKTKEEAEAYYYGTDYWQSLIEDDLENGYLVVFTDGSFKNNVFGWGVVILDSDGKVQKRLSGHSSDEAYISSRNISGEVFGAIAAIEWALKNNHKKLSIYHDYQGIAYWIDGTWNRNMPISIMYRQIHDTYYKGKVTLKFTHVPAHSNVKYNEMADQIAKSAIPNTSDSNKEGAE